MSHIPLDPRARDLMKSHRVLEKTSSNYQKALSKFDLHVLQPKRIKWQQLHYADKVTLILNYMTSLRSSSDPTRGAINTFVRAISWHHNTTLNQQMDPTKDHTIAALRDAIETSFPDIPIHRRQPLSKTQLRALTTTALKWAREGRPQFYRMYVLIILSYKAATRISELLKLTRRDVSIEKDHFSFNFPTRKNKKRRLASMVFIAKDPDSVLCPQATLVEYLHRLEIMSCPTNMSEATFEMQYIFPGAYVHTSTGLPTNHITYSTVNEQLAELLVSIGLDSHNYGWHSTRSSAITHMRQANLSPDSVAAHTGHHDINSLQTYDQKSIETRLIPSQRGLKL